MGGQKLPPALPEFIMLIDRDGQILEFEHLYSRTERDEESLPQTIYDFFPRLQETDIQNLFQFHYVRTLCPHDNSSVIIMPIQAASENELYVLILQDIVLSSTMLVVYHEILEALAHPDPGESLHKTIDLLSRYTNVEAAILWYGDPRGHTLKVFDLWIHPDHRARYQQALKELYGDAMERPLELSGSIPEIIKQKRPVYISDTRHSALWGSDILAKYQIRAFFELPLILQPHFVVVLGLDTGQEKGFSVEERNLFLLISRILASTIERYFLDTFKEKFTEENEFYDAVMELARHLQVQSTPTGLAHTTLEFILEHFPFPAAGLLLPTPSTPQFILYHRCPLAKSFLNKLIEECKKDVATLISPQESKDIQLIRRASRQFSLGHSTLTSFRFLSRIPLSFGLDVIGIFYGISDELDSIPLTLQRKLSLLMGLVSQSLFHLRLREDKSLLIIKNLIKLLPDGIILYDREGTSLFMNDQAEALLQKMGIYTRPLKLDAMRNTPLAPVLERLKDHASVNEIMELDVPEKVVLEIIAKKFTIPSLERGTLLVLRDVTERVMQARFEDMTLRLSALGEMTAGIAHDFNNILSGILGELQLLEAKHNLPPEISEPIQRALDLGFRAGEIIHQLLDFSRQTPDKELKPLDLKSFLKETVKVLRHTLPENLEIQLDYHEGEEYWVLGEPSAFHQIFINLALNAKDAMPDGGILRFRLRAIEPDLPALPSHLYSSERLIEITVEDTGCGIPEENLSRIFEPFFTTKQKGTGLGLSQVYGLVKKLHGHIDVKSVLHQGTRFTLMFPAYKSQPPDIKETNNDLLSAEREAHIVLIEDNPHVSQIMQQMLLFLGYTVSSFGNATDAYTYLQNPDHSIDLILTDLVLPDEKGVSHINRLRKIRTNVPIIAITGYSIDHLSDQQRPFPDIPVLQKPVSLKQLATAITSVLPAENIHHDKTD